MAVRNYLRKSAVTFGKRDVRNCLWGGISGIIYLLRDKVMWKVSPRKESLTLNLGKVSYVLTVLGTASYTNAYLFVASV
jgi:hypothetical protein